MFKLLFGAAIGAAAAWFLDPRDGTRRRNMARDKGLKYARQGKEQAIGQATRAGTTIKGKATAAAPGTGRSPAGERMGDPGLKSKLESEIFRAADSPKERVSVNVEDGIAYLRGEVEDPATIERLREAAAKVDGIRSVESLLHTPGQPAPAKEESHTTASTSA
jgi:osmotically-inducible protein OsmY